MSLADFTEARLKKLAKEFVRIYLEHGDIAAGAWASKEIYEHQYEDFRPHVHKEFLDQGYEIMEYKDD